jgi:hypothetical protein
LGLLEVFRIRCPGNTGQGIQETVIFIDGIDQKVRIFETNGLPEGAYPDFGSFDPAFWKGASKDLGRLHGTGAKHSSVA